jgi:hypothetical protein
MEKGEEIRVFGTEFALDFESITEILDEYGPHPVTGHYLRTSDNSIFRIKERTGDTAILECVEPHQRLVRMVKA